MEFRFFLETNPIETKFGQLINHRIRNTIEVKYDDGYLNSLSYDPKEENIM